MNLADVFTFLFVILGFVIVFVAYWLATSALFPAVTERCAERLGSSPIKATLLGGVIGVPLLVIGSMISNKAPSGGLKVLGLMVVILAILVALAGSSGLALRVGRGMRSDRDEREPWRRVLRGGITLALTFVLPFVGTAVMIWALIAGFGGMILSLPRRQRLPAIKPEPEPASPLEASVP